jgi:hypothetical protein
MVLDSAHLIDLFLYTCSSLPFPLKFADIVGFTAWSSVRDPCRDCLPSF